MSKKIEVEVQYINNCPESKEIIRRVKLAIFNIDVNYSELIVEDINTAKKIGFHGSPTLLINGEDFEGSEKLECSGLSCRYYENGLPTMEEIKNKILSIKKRSTDEKDGNNFIFCIGFVANLFMFK